MEHVASVTLTSGIAFAIAAATWRLKCPVISVTNMRTITFAILIISAGAGLNYGAELNQEAIKAWDGYLQSAEAQMKERLEGGKPFLWAQERQCRMALLSEGQIPVEPVTPTGRTEITDAIIHHWVGAVFIPGVTPDRVVEILDEYDRYHEFYKPTVVSSRLLAREGSERQFSMRWEKKTAGVRNAIDAVYEAWYAPSGQDRWWSIARTTRVQEIEHFGRRDEHLRPVGEGAGYVWRLCSITRLLQLDHGTVVEVEAIALSRDVPNSIAWLVNPIISRMSRNALVTTLEQTKQAVTRSGAEAPLSVATNE